MQTDIYALTEFSPRKGENIAKGYLQRPVWGDSTHEERIIKERINMAYLKLMLDKREIAHLSEDR